jgi:hypothetical protein
MSVVPAGLVVTGPVVTGPALVLAAPVQPVEPVGSSWTPT